MMFYVIDILKKLSVLETVSQCNSHMKFVSSDLFFDPYICNVLLRFATHGSVNEIELL